MTDVKSLLDDYWRGIEDAHPAIEDGGSMWHSAHCGTCSRWFRNVHHPCPTARAAEKARAALRRLRAEVPA